MGEDFGLAGTFASSAADYMPFVADYTNNAANIAATLNPAALTGVAGTLAEEGKDIATGLMPNLTPALNTAVTSTGPGLAATTSFGPWAQTTGVTPLTNNYFGTGWTPSTPGVFDGIKEIGSDTMKYFNDNSKGIEAGGKLVGGLGGLYYQNQMAGLAKQQLKDQRANTAYNRGRQAAGDKSLADASARVFGA